MNLRKSLMAALLGLAIAAGFGIGATSIHASIQQDDSAAAGKTCPVQSQCPMDASRATCPISG